MNFSRYGTLILSAALLSGCSAQADLKQAAADEAAFSASSDSLFTVEAEAEDFEETYDLSKAVQIACGETVSISGNGASVSDGTITISVPGTYVLEGSLEGRILIQSESSGTVRLVLNNVQIHSPQPGAIVILQADKTIITVSADTENSVSDSSSEDESDVTAAIYSKDDLVINGSGKLTVNGENQNGIQSKDSLYIVHAELNVTAADDGIKGKDVLYLCDSDIQVTASSDGLKATNDSDPLSGNILIQGGSLTVDAQDDGIQAVTWLEIEEADITVTAGGGAPQTAGYGDFEQMFEPGGEMPDMNSFEGGQQDMPQMPSGEQGGFGGQMPQGEGGGFNGQMPDMPQGERPQMPSGGQMPDMGGMTPPQNGEQPEMPDDEMIQNAQPQETDTAEESQSTSKGVKADTAILIQGGSISIDSSDDAIHCDGNITVKSGTIQISSGDDAVHADGTLQIDGGSLTAEKCYEGLEGYAIIINDGVIQITASDDGINASDPDASGDSLQADASSLEIHGGSIVIDSGGDGIDTNGSGVIDGGTVIVYGPVSGADSALDHNGSFVINGGTVYAGGSAEMVEIPESSSQSCILAIGTDSGTVTFKDKDGNTVGSYESEKRFSHLIYASQQLKKGETYTVYENDQELGTITIEDTVSYINTSAQNQFPGGMMKP